MAQVRIQAGRGVGARFMKKNGAGGAVRVALHHHRAVADVRQQHRRDVGVVLNQVALGDPALGPERLAQVRQAHLAAGDGQRRVVDVGRESRS